MDPQLVAPYIASQIVAVMYIMAAWRRPRAARFLAGAGFLVAGAFNIWTASTSPEQYVLGFGPHAFPPYRQFIYGTFARHTAAFVVAIACGQIAVGTLILARSRWRSWGYAGAIVFLCAITPLGAGSAAPATLIFAIGIALLLREEATRQPPRGGKPTVAGARLRIPAWRSCGPAC